MLCHLNHISRFRDTGISKYYRVNVKLNIALDRAIALPILPDRLANWKNAYSLPKHRPLEWFLPYCIQSRRIASETGASIVM
jgi:hypothetical protein